LGLSEGTISKGIKELDAGPSFDARIRSIGAGRKRCLNSIENIDNVFLEVLKDNTAGDPMNENIHWTNLTQKEISEKMEDRGTSVSVTVIKQLLRKYGYVKRKQQKKITMKSNPNRSQQFVIINALKKKYLTSNTNPVISMDTKKKEFIGNFYREGKLYSLHPVEVYDHDFNSFAEGIVIPYGIYDLKKNFGFVTLGTSHDTAEFVSDSLFCWWTEYGNYDYPHATSILILCDAGGSNNCRHYIFKQELQKLANKIGLEIRVAHYPQYCSKYNPIEHRLFPHLSRVCKGVVFKSIGIVKSLMDNARTSKGLRVVTKIVDKVYQTGRRVAECFKENMQIIFDKSLPQLNYVVRPQNT
jgi:hypothetical protein